MNILLKLTLINCGFITEYLAIKLKLSEKYLKSLVESKALCSKSYMLFGKVTKIYTLSDRSLEKIRDEGYYIYKHDSTQLEHDYLLAKVFLSISEEAKITWQNEIALKYKFQNKITTDAVFVQNGKITGVEILTPSYDKETKNNKMQFITNYCDNHIILNTKDFSRR